MEASMATIRGAGTLVLMLLGTLSCSSSDPAAFPQPLAFYAGALGAIASAGISPSGPPQGPSSGCHVTDGAFTACANGRSEWSDISALAFSDANAAVYADQADLDPARSTPSLPVDTFMLLYDDCARVTPLGSDQYFLVSFDTIEGERDNEELKRYTVHIFGDGTLIFFEDGVAVTDAQGRSRVAEIEGQTGAAGFGQSPRCPFNHLIVEYQIDLEVAGGHSYSPDPIFWGGTPPGGGPGSGGPGGPPPPPPGTPPIARNDEASIDNQSTVNVDVLANDTDPDGTVDRSTIVVTQGRYGAVAVESNGTVTYAADPARFKPFIHADSFTYTVKDDSGLTSNQAIVDIIEACPATSGASLDGKSAPQAAGATSRRGTDVDKDGLDHETEIRLGTDVCHHDTDGDGLLDSWEAADPAAGFDLDADGQVDVQSSRVFEPLGLPDPLHKDVYVEIDAFDCAYGGCPPGDPMEHGIDSAALAQVRGMLGSLPVQNADGLTGITLHIEQDERLKHEPNCDQPGISDRSHFGTVDQRTSPALIAAKTLSVRYLLSGHSTFADDSTNCSRPNLFQMLQLLFGPLPLFPDPVLPDYDNTPFGSSSVGGRDIITSLGPLWVCPQEKVVSTFPNPSFLGLLNPQPLMAVCTESSSKRLFPSLFPALVRDHGITQPVQKPYARLLCSDLGDPLLSEHRGRTQLTSRALAHLLGHALGIPGEGDVANEPPITMTCPGPDPYGALSSLTLAASLYTLGVTGDHLSFTPNIPGASIPEHTVFDNPIEEALGHDLDGDGIIEREDNCTGAPNPGQEDLDGDGTGDPCDRDMDGDGIENSADQFPRDTDNDGVPNLTDSDDDGDGVPDASDNCPLVANPGQQDTDGDGIGNACDPDSDNDGIGDLVEALTDSDRTNPASVPEFVLFGNSCSDGIDNDLDGKVDGADDGCVDSDGDSLPNYLDSCPLIADLGWRDLDGDGLGDACDPDIDADGVDNARELQFGSDPFDAKSTPEANEVPGSCSDGIDNDGDHLVDGADLRCLAPGAGGSASADPRSSSWITVRSPFTKDANRNSYTVYEYSTTPDGPWTLACGNGTAGEVDWRYCTIGGLFADSTYFVKVTFVDPDGVVGANPQIVGPVRTRAASPVTTTVEPAKVQVKDTHILVTVPIRDDANTNSSLQSVEVAPSADGPWTQKCGPFTSFNPKLCRIHGLTQGTSYWVRLLVNDPDGLDGQNQQLVGPILYTGQTDLALGKPIGGDPGWGCCSDPSHLVDGRIENPDWFYGFAWTGGTSCWAGGCPPGFKQQTIDLGTPQQVGRVDWWTHDSNGIPTTWKVSVSDDGSSFSEVFSTNESRCRTDTLPFDINWAVPSCGHSASFSPVTARFVRYSFDDRTLFGGFHGWAVEIEVFGQPSPAGLPGDAPVQLAGADQSQIALAPTTARARLGSQHTVTATLTGLSPQATSGTPVVFRVVSGPNAGRGGAVSTDANGIASFSYVGNTGLGTDRIVASFFDVLTGKTVSSAPAEMTWTPADGDNDGVADDRDNCPTVTNSDQADQNLNGIGDACETADLRHSTAAFLQARLDGGTVGEPTSLLVRDEPDLVGRIARIVEFRVAAGLSSSPTGLTGRLTDSLVSLGIVPADQKGAFESAVLAQLNHPPVCTNVTADRIVLSPPNHKMIKVTLTGATDPDAGDTVALVVDRVAQDEPTNGLGDGDTPIDAQLTSPLSNAVLLRAERSGTGDGRVYRVHYRAADQRGGTCEGTVRIGVPRDAAHGAAVDSAPPSFDSLL